MEVSHFGISKIGRERKWIFPGTGSGFHTSKNRQQQPRPNGQIPPRQGDKAGPSNPMEGKPKGQVWVDNVEAPARAKTLRGRILSRWRSTYS